MGWGLAGGNFCLLALIGGLLRRPLYILTTETEPGIVLESSVTVKEGDYQKPPNWLPKTERWGTFKHVREEHKVRGEKEHVTRVKATGHLF